MFPKGPLRRRGETTSAQRNPFPLQAELTKLISAVAQNSTLKYFSFKKVKLKSYLKQNEMTLTVLSQYVTFWMYLQVTQET